MTPYVAIALITKLKLIFETDAEGNKLPDKFLSFQNGSFPVSKENFYFIEPDKYQLGPIDAALKMVDFSRSFNFITAVDDFISPAPDELEDVYYQTLKTAIAANSTRTQEEEQRYNAAKDFLYELIQTPDGQSVTCLANYDSYENQYKEALSEYKSRALASLNARGDDGSEIKTAFQLDEPNLKKAIAAALLNWETLGKRAEVEKYLGDFLSLSGSSPGKMIADLKLEYELFTKAGSVDHLANELHYIPTYFTPVNFFEDNISWQQMKLEKAEVTALVEQAPRRLKDLFDISTQDIDINKISFEYTVVEIIREWLHYKDFLLQHFWKLPDGAVSLSDGKTEGRLPAFPDKMIFIRNLKIETPVPKPSSPVRWHLNRQLIQELKPEINTTLQNNSKVLINRKVKADSVRSIMAKDNTFFSPRVLMHTATASPELSKAPLTKVVLKSNDIKKKPAVPHNTTLQPLFLKAGFAAVSKRATANTVNVASPVDGPVKAQDTTATEKDQQGMELLAFICKKVPVCPSPDIRLKWD
ncbi:MAG: hypothetical protein M9904_14015 [Chitinophagaceae bacterium]|nr:hypothetical protein [Chitinophagaceae bacterium]MCO5241162.1 hypothetical protein [Chitinophagaceae bacterium]